MIGNLLNQGTTGWYLFTVSFAALLLAFTAVTAINFALIYGSGRFDEAAKLGLAQKRPLLTLILGCLAAPVLTVCVYLRTTPKEQVSCRRGTSSLFRFRCSHSFPSNKQCSADSQTGKEAMLSDWAHADKNGVMPALLINSMLVERGAPIVFLEYAFSHTQGPTSQDRKPYPQFLRFISRAEIRCARLHCGAALGIFLLRGTCVAAGLG